MCPSVPLVTIQCGQQEVLRVGNSGSRSSICRQLVPGARQISGYVGSSESGVVKLYPVLSQPDEWLEFSADSVLHHYEDPEVSDGRRVLWLKPDSTMTATSRQHFSAASLPRTKLALNAETIRVLTNLAVAPHTVHTVLMISGPARCTVGAGNCTGQACPDSEEACRKTFGDRAC
jgi:hypothetical protein